VQRHAGPCKLVHAVRWAVRCGCKIHRTFRGACHFAALSTHAIVHLWAPRTSGGTCHRAALSTHSLHLRPSFFAVLAVLPSSCFLCPAEATKSGTWSGRRAHLWLWTARRPHGAARSVCAHRLGMLTHIGQRCRWNGLRRLVAKPLERHGADDCATAEAERDDEEGGTHGCVVRKGRESEAVIV